MLKNPCYRNEVPISQNWQYLWIELKIYWLIRLSSKLLKQWFTCYFKYLTPEADAICVKLCFILCWKHKRGPSLHHHLPLGRKSFTQLSLDLSWYSCITERTCITANNKIYIKKEKQKKTKTVETKAVCFLKIYYYTQFWNLMLSDISSVSTSNFTQPSY